jgi:hypothetical protein
MRSTPNCRRAGSTMRSTSGSPPTRPGSAHRRTSRGWNGRCSTSAAISGPRSPLPTWPTPRTGWRSGAGRRPGCGCTAPPRGGRPKCSPNWRPAICCRSQSPMTSWSHPAQGAPRLSRGSRPGVVLGAGASAPLEPGRPGRQPARVLSSPSRRPHVTRRAMISRTQVRSARPPWVCTVRIRKWSSAG